MKILSLIPVILKKLTSRLSFRAQAFLVFLIGLACIGAAMVFINAYVISGLKANMVRQAYLLAEDLGQQTSANIEELLRADNAQDLLALQENPLLARHLEVTFRSNKTVIAACVVNSKGEVVLADYGQNKAAWKLKRSKGSLEAELIPDPSNFTNISLRLVQMDPQIKTRTMEIPIARSKDSMGRLKMLISENEIYQDISAASRDITRRLWSTVLAFVGLLALSIYSLTGLFRRQVVLLEQNERLDRMAYVGTLASGLAHEIRNPLNAMSVNLAVAEEEIVDGRSQTSETLQLILTRLRREISRMNRTITGFMEFSHSNVDRQGSVDLHLLVGEVLDLLRAQIEEAKISTNIELPQEAQLRADFSGLRQVLYNLVLNAVQAIQSSPEKTRIRKLDIGGRRESAQWVLWIEDTGPGIRSGEEMKIFEAFHSNKPAGTGLGLAIARTIIASHDGEIRALRTAHGGLRMEITLPETLPKKKMESTT